MHSSNTLDPTPSSAIASMSAFDGLSRGAEAPEWVVEGIRRAWLPGATDVTVSLIAVSENATFRVNVAENAAMVVRLQQPGYVGDASNVRSELQWVEALRADTDVRTPAPVRGAGDELVQSLVAADGAVWTAVAFEFVSGRILEQHEDFTAHFTELGRITAALHRHARSWSKPAGFTRFDWDLGDMVGERPRWGSWQDAALDDSERAVLAEAQGRALEVLAPLQKSPQHWGLIHSDLRPSNVMLDGGELTVIDFDDAGSSWYLYDFASALTFYEHRRDAAQMAANWIAGYTEIIPLSRDDLRHAAALSVVRRLTMLGWSTTHRADALPADLWNENLPGTVEVAARYLRSPGWLVDQR